VVRTHDEIATRRREGYARVILAGQSFGGAITLEAAESSKDVYGVVAMAPGLRAIGGAGRLDAAVTERTIGHLAVDRLSLVFPRHDTMFGGLEQGPGATSVLAGRNGSFLLLDEKYDIVDHGGGTTGKFAIKYGLCLIQYLTSLEVGNGSAARAVWRSRAERPRSFCLGAPTRSESRIPVTACRRISRDFPAPVMGCWSPLEKLSRSPSSISRALA
jgi:pimeloyl-ACP methyl ester carboxylesterase